MIAKIKIITAYLLTLLLTLVTFGGYAYRQKKKAEQAERENERLLFENQGLIEYGQRVQDALTENAKRKAQIERDLNDGKRDHFEHSNW